VHLWVKFKFPSHYYIPIIIILLLSAETSKKIQYDAYFIDVSYLIL
jgi:hypothetical protein